MSRKSKTNNSSTKKSVNAKIVVPIVKINIIRFLIAERTMIRTTDVVLIMAMMIILIMMIMT